MPPSMLIYTRRKYVAYYIFSGCTPYGSSSNALCPTRHARPPSWFPPSWLPSRRTIPSARLWWPPSPWVLTFILFQCTADLDHFLASNRLPSKAIAAPCCLIIFVVHGRRNPKRRGESRASSIAKMFVRSQHVPPRPLNSERFVVVHFTDKPTAPSHIGCELESACITGCRMHNFESSPCKLSCSTDK